MASRPILPAFPVIKNGDMSGILISIPSIIDNISEMGYDISWTGTPTGTFSVQISNTYTQSPSGSAATLGNWTTVTLNTVPMAVGSPGNGYIDIVGISAYAIRLVYTPSGGTGVLNATIFGKVS